MSTIEGIVAAIVEAYPHTQAIYLFGSYGTENEWPDSDVDIAILLPPDEAREVGTLILSDLHLVLQSLLKKDVDLINLRQVSTVLQKEIIFSGRRVFCADKGAADEFEMLTLSKYQRLNEERRAILDSFQQTGKAYAV